MHLVQCQNGARKSVSFSEAEYEFLALCTARGMAIVIFSPVRSVKAVQMEVSRLCGRDGASS